MTATFPRTETDPQFAAGGATDAELDAAIADVNTALAAKQESATAATDAELSAAVDTLNAALAAKQDAASAATDAEVAAAIAAHAAGDATDAELAAAVASLEASIAEKQDAATAATDAELAAAVAALEAAVAAKQDAASAATDAELAAGLADKLTTARVKTARQATGNIAAAAIVNVDVPWPSAFAGAYTLVGLALVEAGAGNRLQILRVVSADADKIVVMVRNNDALGAHAGTIHATGLADA